MAPVDMKFLSGEIFNCPIGKCIIALTFHDPFCVEAANNCHVADALIRYREEIFHQVEIETSFRNAFFLSGSWGGFPHCLQPWYSMIQTTSLLKHNKIYIVNSKGSVPREAFAKKLMYFTQCGVRGREGAQYVHQQSTAERSTRSTWSLFLFPWSVWFLWTIMVGGHMVRYGWDLGLITNAHCCTPDLEKACKCQTACPLLSLRSYTCFPIPIWPWSKQENVQLKKP